MQQGCKDWKVTNRCVILVALHWSIDLNPNTCSIWCSEKNILIHKKEQWFLEPFYPLGGAIFFPPMTVNALPGPKPSNTVRGFAERIGNGVRSSNLKGDVAHVLKALSVDPILKYLRRLPLTLVQASQSIIRKCSDMKYVSGSIFNLIDERWESLWWALGTPDVSSFGHLASTCFWAITPFHCNKMTCYSINDITSVLF